jgi:signal transduction histidine kinase
VVVLEDDPGLVSADDDERGALGYRGSVRTQVKRYLFDALIVVAVVGAIVEFAFEPNDPEYTATSSLWFLAPAAALTIGSLLLRRRFPFGAPAAAFAAVAAVSLVEANFAPGSFVIFLTVIVSALLLGMVPERRLALAGIPVYVAALTVAIREHPTDGLEAFVFVALILTCAWAAGFALRSKLAEADARRLRAEEAARDAVAEERARITRELHDVLAHSVSVMTVQASAVRRLLNPEQEREREALLTVEETGRQALAEMRRLLGIMRTDAEPAARAPQPGIDTLPQLLEQVRRSGLPVELTVEGTPVHLPAGVDLSAYRIVQEALTSALEHGAPGHAWVAVRYGGEDLEIEVANDGSSESGGDGAGHGLVGMRERVALCGGELTSGPRPGGGYRIAARLPVAGGAA